MKEDPDIPFFSTAMDSYQGSDWLQTMKKEISALQVCKTWVVVSKDKVPEGVKVAPTTWDFKLKRFPSGEFRSFKARFCVQGYLQKKVMTDIETYAPVVQWSTLCYS